MTENAPATPTTKPAKKKGKPGAGWFGAAIIVFVAFLAIDIMANMTTNAYGEHVGGATPLGILMTFALPLILAAIGFCRRVLFLLETRGK